MPLKTTILLMLILASATCGATQTSASHAKPARVATDNSDPEAALLAQAKASGDQAQEKWESAASQLTAAQLEYQAFSLKHAEKVYEWQHLSTIMIFAVVVLLMLAGIVFSWIQFRQGMHHPVQAVASVSSISTTGDPSQSPTVSEVTTEKNMVTEFSASPQGIKVASSTLGVIILVISMCFFYMYLRYVYPISIENANQAVSQAVKAKTQ